MRLCALAGLLAVLVLTGRTDAFCPVGCFCDDETLQVTCDEANLEVIPITLNPSVQRLVLRQNKIKTVDDTALRFYVELLYVDFSHNRLVSIQDRTFEGQRKLNELRLDHNKISVIGNGTWLGLSRDLTILSLRENYISSLDERAFATAGRIRELDLGRNRLEQIHPEAFAGLPNLRVLYLDSNKLSYNSPPSFPAFLTPLRPLAELSLAGNDLPWLADGLFSALSELSQLDLSGCGVRNVSTEAFRGLSQLRGLKFHDNLLSVVPTHAWPPLSHLEVLTLGQNNISVIGQKAFSGLVRLKQLDVNDAVQLTTVDADALHANRELVQLRLTNCKRLAKLPEGLLARSVNLRRLVLRDNGLTSLSDKMWGASGPGQFQLVDLGGNPFHCDCNLLWLRDYLLGTFKTSVGSVTVTHHMKRRDVAAENQLLAVPTEAVCASPLPVSNMALSSLTDDELGCRTSLMRSPQLVVGLVAAGAACLLVFAACVACRFRRRIRQSCCGASKPHPAKAEDARTLSSKWKPASPNTSWGISAPGAMNHGVSLIGNNRVPEYQKACSQEEECFMRAVTLHNSLKPFPRTEL
ncbi:Insulin-like growth factor-binding protein complex acid labile chain [Daphnia sinensis]|uniref:Insulin-like growth factor-binding protein complex acid labile chain n=1 Tax=Daphnia sinensis TaxID=1820382 RepID=A0AAD5PZ16_9CRUS|nr:Insulin-like growth factor-binding protein complex acid labile chain [Daphnia sinensis]